MSLRVEERDFKLLWTGSAVAQFGAVGALTGTPLLALSLDDSPISAGWVSAAGALPGLLFHLPAGWLADRANRGMIMLCSQLVRIAAALVLVFGLWLAGGPVWLLAFSVAVAGTSAVFYGVAENAAVRDLVYGPGAGVQGGDGAAERRRRFAMAGYEARQYIALVLGRPAGGFLFDVWRLLPFVLDAVTAGLSLFLMRRAFGWRMRWRRWFARIFRWRSAGAAASAPPHSRADRRPRARKTRRSLRLLAKDRFLWTVLLVCSIANFLFQTVVLLLIFSANQRGISGSLTGVFLSASGVGGLAGAIAAGRTLRKRTPPEILLFCVYSWMILVFVVASVNHPLVGLLAWGGCSYMGAHVNVALEVHKAAFVPGDLQGRITGVIGFLAGGAVPLGALCGGYLVAELEPQATAWWVALVMFALALGVTVVCFKWVVGKEAYPGAASTCAEPNLRTPATANDPAAKKPPVPEREAFTIEALAGHGFREAREAEENVAVDEAHR